MPIKPENRDRYPANWKTEIRPAILERAAHRCEWCGKPNGETVEVRIFGGGPVETLFWFDEGRGAWRFATGVPGAEPPSDIAAALKSDAASERCKPVKVVLTIAHLDHVPENCEPGNLRALCQRCHLTYDAPEKARRRRTDG